MTETNATSAAEETLARFEESLGELEALVDRLEGEEDLTLEESLALFARGVALTRTCREALDCAEQRVRILTEQSADAPLEPFLSDD